MTAAVRITSIVAALDELLEPAAFADLGPNGLQVPGGEEARRVVTGVSAQRELIERAIELDAQLLLVHHGLFWDFHPTGLTPVLAERLRPLFKHDVALAAYHIPLDAHPEVGNNAILANALGCERHEPFGDFKGRAVGRAGTFGGDGVPAPELFARVREVTGREPLVQGLGPELVRRIGIVSGSAASSLDEAAALGLDAFLTGEPREHVMADARELGIHFIAAGHYATETFGVRALGDWLAGRFGIEHVFVDVPNPV
jgi:dinuclear metal center YbgI/SA1388 family protein